MSFLFPLYALGALAIAAPVLFHFFQRRPHGKQDFSSLMFLRSTPPKLTRRSRLSDWLLLLLRGLALLFLAMAFSRPFLRSTTLLDLEAPSRSIVLLVDVSASMRRAEAFDKLSQRVRKTLDDIGPTDQLSLLAYDDQVETLVSFAAWQEADPAKRKPLVLEQLSSLQPSWRASNLGAGLMQASDALLQQRLAEDLSQPLQIVLFSDLQVGSDLEALQSYEWPEEIRVELQRIEAEGTSNASMVSLPPAESDTDAAQVRVLVRNAADSQAGQFSLSWKDSSQTPVSVHVPPGQTRVAQLTQPNGAQQLLLEGDDTPFDNELFLTETVPQAKNLYYIGEDDSSDNQSLAYFLEQVSLNTRDQEVTTTRLEDLTTLATLSPPTTPFLVLSKQVGEEATKHLRQYVDQGGRLCFVIRAEAELSSTTAFLSSLLEVTGLTLAEHPVRDYAMLSMIDFDHPVFQPFADPRFSDFTKIHFWQHRQLSVGEESGWRTLARFDDGFPALVEKPVGKGVVFVFTSGWQPADSQLALSSKFVPLLHGLFGHGNGPRTSSTTLAVGTPLSIPEEGGGVITSPDGMQSSVGEVSSFTETDVPGIYHVQQGTTMWDVAVNLAADESRTSPMMPDQLEQLGVRLGRAASVEAIEQEQRQMRNKELESRQKLWRWGIVAALVLIALETLVSMRGRPVPIPEGVSS